MAELPNYGGNVLAAFGAGRDMRMRDDAAKRAQQANMLAGAAYNTRGDQREAALGQLANVDAGAAVELGSQLQGADDKKLQKLYGAARYLEQARQTKNPAQIEGAWAAVRPYLAREFPEGQFAEQWDDAAMAPVLYKVLAEGGAAGGDDLKSVRVGNDGYYYAIQGGQMVNTGIKAAPSIKILEQEGQLPAGYVTSGGRAGEMVPLGGAGAGAAAPSAGANAQPAAGTREISGMQVGASNEIDGAPVPFDQLPQDEQQAFIQTMLSGQTVKLPERGGPGALPDAGVVAAGGGQGPVRTPTAAEKAAATEAAQQAVRLQYAPALEGIETEAALARAQGTATIESQAKRAASQVEKNAALAVYEQGMAGLTSGLDQAATGPIVGRLPAMTTSQQIAEGGVAAMAPILKQMFRTAGEGTFTDKDQDLLMKMVPTRTDTREAREAKIRNIDNIVRAKLGAASPSVAPAPSSTPGVRRYNPATRRLE